MLTFSDSHKDVGYAFSLMGLLVKLTHTVRTLHLHHRVCALTASALAWSTWVRIRSYSFHEIYLCLTQDRDGSRMKMIIPEELEQRRAFWWELLHLDCRLVSCSEYDAVSHVN